MKIKDLEPVILESPYTGSIDKNVRYARACMHDCLTRGEAPFASHLLYTQPGVLDDADPEERELGIHAGFTYRKLAKKTVVYDDFGLSTGMKYGIDHAKEIGHQIEYRSLPREVVVEIEGQ